MIIICDIDQFWRVTKLTSRSIWKDCLDITQIHKFDFIPSELFNMWQITYLYFDISRSSDVKLNRIPINRRVNLRNVDFDEISFSANHKKLITYVNG